MPLSISRAACDSGRRLPRNRAGDVDDHGVDAFDVRRGGQGGVEFRPCGIGRRPAARRAGKGVALFMGIS